MLQKFNERNRDLIVNINGKLAHRDQAVAARQIDVAVDDAPTSRNNRAAKRVRRNPLCSGRATRRRRDAIHHAPLVDEDQGRLDTARRSTDQGGEMRRRGVFGKSDALENRCRPG